MIDRRMVLTLMAGGALALPGVALAGPPNTPPGQGGTPPGQAGAAPGGGKQKSHKNGETLLGEKIKENGNHGLGKAGKIDVSADVRGGKVVGFHAKHPDKGELTVGKVKSTEKFALLEQHPGANASVQLAQAIYVWYYAYWFIDEYGDYWYYWFPVAYIIDDGSWVIYYA
jgi:hypothetical protein